MKINTINFVLCALSALISGLYASVQVSGEKRPAQLTRQDPAGNEKLITKYDHRPKNDANQTPAAFFDLQESKAGSNKSSENNRQSLRSANLRTYNLHSQLAQEMKARKITLSDKSNNIKDRIQKFNKELQSVHNEVDRIKRFSGFYIANDNLVYRGLFGVSKVTVIRDSSIVNHYFVRHRNWTKCESHVEFENGLPICMTKEKLLPMKPLCVFNVAIKEETDKDYICLFWQTVKRPVSRCPEGCETTMAEKIKQCGSKTDIKFFYYKKVGSLILDANADVEATVTETKNIIVENKSWGYWK